MHFYATTKVDVPFSSWLHGNQGVSVSRIDLVVHFKLAISTSFVSTMPMYWCVVYTIILSASEVVMHNHAHSLQVLQVYASRTPVIIHYHG